MSLIRECVEPAEPLGASDEISGSPNSRFIDGLYRVAKPVAGNANYLDILGDRPARTFRKLGLNVLPDFLTSAQAQHFLDRQMASMKVSQHMVPPRCILAFGKTRNNLREFRFLQSILEKSNGVEFSLFNCGLNTPFPTNTYATDYPALLGHVREGFRAFLREQDRVPIAVYFQLVNYVGSYFNWRETFNKLHCFPPRALVLANDHSPNHVAASMAASEFGIPRVYVQHAEVSDTFPRLDFELAILRNRLSLLTYRRIARPTGEACIVSRSDAPFIKPAVKPNCEQRVEVGVYLTAQVQWREVLSLLESLKKNKSIFSAFLKPHPSMRSHIVRENLGVPVAIESAIPQRPHVAVVPNSSVVVELLHSGIPVFQYFPLDSVPDDYYGFVRQGITEQLEREELEHRFWEGYETSNEWLERFSLYDPDVFDDSRDGERRVTRFFSKTLSVKPRLTTLSQSWLVENQARIQRKPKVGETFFSEAVRKLPDTTADFVNAGAVSAYTRERSPINSKDLIDAVEVEFARRSAISYSLFASVRAKPVNSDYVFWLTRRDIELTGRKYSEQELEELVDFGCHGEDSATPAEARRLHLLLLMMRLGEDEIAEKLLARYGWPKVKSLHINHRTAFLKWFRRDPVRQMRARVKQHELLQDLSAFDLLKLKVLAATEDDYRADPWAHQDVERLFVKRAPAEVSAEFLESVAPVYEKLRDRMRFMDVRWSSRERASFFDFVATALMNRQPFSLVRLSDGEGYIFGEDYKIFTQEDARKRERHWWGEELPRVLRDTFMSDLQKAAKQADVLGIPCIYRFLRDSSSKASTLVSQTQGRGLFEVLMQVKAYPNTNQVYAEEKCNLPLFNDPSRLQPLIEIARRVIVISSAKPERIKDIFSSLVDLHHVTIPTHRRTLDNAGYQSVGVTLPHVFAELRQKVRKKVSPGDLVLVAAGVLGKALIFDAKESGGVVLDIGSSLDEWIQADIHSLF